jgi:hypothetical protein
VSIPTNSSNVVPGATPTSAVSAARSSPRAKSGSTLVPLARTQEQRGAGQKNATLVGTDGTPDMETHERMAMVIWTLVVLAAAVIVILMVAA